MDTQIASYLYKETRINFDSALPNSTVILRLPVPGTLVRSGRSSQKRPHENEVKTSSDEKEYEKRHLASAASIYHRQHHKSPRSFLWRVLEDGKALAVAAIDLTKQENGPENPLTLRFIFGSAIRPGCIALADSKEHDVLTIHALTENNELYTLTLRPDFFRRRAATEDSTSDWCKIYVSSAFTFKHPHRLVAPTADELLVTLHDGGLLRLARKPGYDASTWHDTFYNDGGWTSGLKSLVPWQGSNTVKYGKVNMELPAITAIETREVNGVLCAFAVSLDHRLRIWEMSHGKAIFAGDILGQERKPEELGKWVIHPSQSQLIKIIDDEDGNPIVVTYSPHGAGEFKFWQTNGIPDGEVEMVDMFPDTHLKPPPPTTDIWTMADFAIGRPVGSAATVSLWILWKNNITYRIQTCEFNMLSQSSIENAWKGSWVAAAGETLPDSPLPALTSTDPEDPSQKWLDYIMFPGRYTTATLETALSIYERSVGKADKQATTRTSKNLTERICSIVSSQATLPMSTDGELDFNVFKSATDAQWRRFYRLIVELDKQRGEALSLGFDHDEQLPIIATADGLSVIRDCSQLERLWHNPDNTWGGTSDAVSRLLSSAAAFRENFSNRLQHACDVQLKVELFQEPSLTDIERLQSFYDKCDFAGQIGDEDFTQLYANLGGTFKGFTLKVYQELVNSMASASDEMDIDGRLERLPLAGFGRKVVVKGVQEMVELHRSICIDQLVLLAFIEGEIDQAEEGMRLDTAAVHRMLMAQLKRLEVLEWLSSTTLSIVPMKTERANLSDSFTSAVTANDSPNTKKREDTKTVTVLEGTLNHLFGLLAHSGIAAPQLLTDLLLRVCAPNSDIELQPALIQAFLIKTERPDLALSFSRFCAQDPFSTYIQGRACLASKDLAFASTYFKKAAFGLCKLPIDLLWLEDANRNSTSRAPRTRPALRVPPKRHRMEPPPLRSPILLLPHRRPIRHIQSPQFCHRFREVGIAVR